MLVFELFLIVVLGDYGCFYLHGNVLTVDMVTIAMVKIFMMLICHADVFIYIAT